jgi:hypothetical protein
LAESSPDDAAWARGLQNYFQNGEAMARFSAGLDWAQLE